MNSERLWRKSSYSGKNSNCVEIALAPPSETRWRKSSYSGKNSDCVEVALNHPVGIRDTKDRSVALALSFAAFAALLARHR